MRDLLSPKSIAENNNSLLPEQNAIQQERTNLSSESISFDDNWITPQAYNAFRTAMKECFADSTIVSHSNVLPGDHSMTNGKRKKGQQDTNVINCASNDDKKSPPVKKSVRRTKRKMVN